MGKNPNYSVSFKFKVVVEAITSGKSEAEVARSYNVHPVTVSKWKKTFMEEGAKVFGGENVVKEKEEKIAKLERMLGQKEVEPALMQHFTSGR